MTPDVMHRQPLSSSVGRHQKIFVKREISSTLTFIPKFIAPSVWSIALVILIVADGITVLHFIVWGIGAFCIFFFGVPIKKVFIYGSHLIISNFDKEIRVSLSDIEHVGNNHFFIHTVGVRFNKQTEFGKDIMFMPKTLMTFFPFVSHPIVKELKELSAKK